MRISENKIFSLFSTNFFWNFFGSSTFEFCKLIHQVLLLSYINKSYGIIGSLYALLYATVRISEFGTTNSLSPYYHSIVQSQSSFRSIALRTLGIPWLISIFFGSCCALTLSKYSLNTLCDTTLLYALFFLILSESTRALMRQLLHLNFSSKQIVLVEQGAFLGYLIFLWGGFFGGFFKLTPHTIFIPFVIESLFCSFFFIYFIYNFYKQLPVNTESQQPSLTKRITKTRLINWSIRISRELFTSNILTPLFAVHFGFAQAGFFYFSAAIAMSLHAIIKASIGYTGSALFTKTQQYDITTKLNAFSSLSHRFFMLLIPLCSIMLFSYHPLKILMQKKYYDASLALTFVLYLSITLLDFFSVLYEQLYFAENRPIKLLYIKIIECLLVGIALNSLLYETNIPTILITLCCIKTLCLIILYIDAYKQWGIRLSLKSNIKTIIASTVLGAATALLLSFL